MNQQIKIFWFKITIVILVLFGITLIAYKDALKGGLVWDAGGYLIDNPYIMALSWDNIKWMFSTFYMYNWHPLTWLSYALDYWLYGAIWGVALTNIILHCVNTILVFIFALFLICAHRQQGTLFKDINNQDFVSALVAALLFGIHPQHVESVAWLAERKDVLCLFFVLLTFIFYMVYARLEVSRKRIIYYWVTLACFVMALLSKPMAVTIPFLLILGDFYPLKRVSLKDIGNISRINWSLIKKLFLDKLPFVFLSLVLMAITLFAQTTAINPLDKFGFQIRLLNAVRSYFFYISKMLFPINLLPLYTDFPNTNDLSNFIYIAGFLLITALFLYLWHTGRQYWLTAWLFYVIALLPVIGIVKVGVQSLADRYAYLPTIPFYVLIGCGFTVLVLKIKYLFLRIIAISSMIVIFLSLFFMTVSQVIVWQNELYLWSYIAKIIPNHGPANTGLGNYYFNQGDYEKAVEHYQNAGNSGGLIVYSIPPWAISYLKLNKLNEALLLYKYALEKKSDVGISNSCIYYNIGLIYARQGLLDYAKQSLLLVGTDSPDDFFKAHQILLKIENFDADRAGKADESFSIYQYCEKYRVYSASNIYGDY